LLTPRAAPPSSFSPFSDFASPTSWSGDSSAAGGFARAVQSRASTSDRLHRGVDLVVELMDGCDHVGVTVAFGRSGSTVAATDELARRGDELQYELDEGPCLDTVRQQHTVISQDLTVDRRWLRWGPRVSAELGVNAMMSLLLYTDRDAFGALNLYADRPDVWDNHAIALGHALADQLATALADAREIEGRPLAMASRNLIGQAQGILMERYGLDADRAFDYLRRISQDHNRKLLTVAGEIVDTRQLPSDPRRSSNDPQPGPTEGPS
jgi:hypothetical protein